MNAPGQSRIGLEELPEHASAEPCNTASSYRHGGDYILSSEDAGSGSKEPTSRAKTDDRLVATGLKPHELDQAMFEVEDLVRSAPLAKEHHLRWIEDRGWKSL